MSLRHVLLVSLASLLAVGLGFTARSAGIRAAHAARGPAVTRSRPSDRLVLVELFTSEGCSSCPPADDVLARLERTQPVAGARIVPLAFHVGYWDELGWPDPFASSVFTARQRQYSRDGRMYTPQAVVDGREEVVGSREQALVQAIERAADRARVPVTMALRFGGLACDVAVHVEAWPGSDRSEARVLVALTQARASVTVPRGENAGKTLHHAAIVRALETAGVVAARGGDAHATVRVPAGIPKGELRVVAFAQDTGSLAVLGSAERPFTDRADP